MLFDVCISGGAEKLCYFRVRKKKKGKKEVFRGLTPFPMKLINILSQNVYFWARSMKRGMLN